MLATLLLVARMFVTAAAAPLPADQVRTIIADGSVWADVGGNGSNGVIVASYRLADVDERARWIVLDADGDGHSDVVAIVVDSSFRPHVAVWRNTGDGFVAMPTDACDGRVAWNTAAYSATL
jgi:hypothetical protein